MRVWESIEFSEMSANEMCQFNLHHVDVSRTNLTIFTAAALDLLICCAVNDKHRSVLCAVGQWSGWKKRTRRQFRKISCLIIAHECIRKLVLATRLAIAYVCSALCYKFSRFLILIFSLFMLLLLLPSVVIVVLSCITHRALAHSLTSSSRAQFCSDYRNDLFYIFAKTVSRFVV